MTILNAKCLNEVKTYYKGGKGLKKVPLKNYTSGDGTNKGFESLVESIIWYVIDDLGIDRERVDIHNQYFQSDYSVKSAKDPKDPQRMDHHIKIDGKHPLIVESRAWIDKPFYTMKRAVTRNFMELPYVRKQLTMFNLYMWGLRLILWIAFQNLWIYHKVTVTELMFLNSRLIAVDTKVAIISITVLMTLGFLVSLNLSIII